MPRRGGTDILFALFADSMTTAAPILTHCPNCGAKLKRADLSLCAYCATPLQLGGKVEGASDETTKRLLRLRDNPQFAPLMSWTPGDHAVLTRMRAFRGQGVALMLACVACALTAVFVETKFVRIALEVAAGLFALCGAWRFERLWSLDRAEKSKPMLRRASIVLERRSETRAEISANTTVYFFTLRFDDGSEGEFQWPGQGTLYEPMANGMTGVAFTRGDKLVEFKRL